MKFYTNITVKGSNLFVFGYDKNGLRTQKKIKYRPYLYIKSPKESETKTLFGESLERLDFPSIKDMRDFLYEYKGISGAEPFGMTDPRYLWISDNFKETIDYTYDWIRIVDLDIETSIGDAFPDIKKADRDITAITINDRKHKRFYCLYNKEYGTHKEFDGDIEVRWLACDNEEELLYKFIALWKRLEIDVVTGWNLVGFDIPYIVNRISKVISREYCLKLSPTNVIKERMVKEKYGDGETPVYSIEGVQIVDYLEIYKKFSLNSRESYKLDDIAEYELGEKKVDYQEYGSLKSFYEKNWAEFLRYNIIDAQLIEKLDDKLRYLELCFNISYFSRITTQDVMSPVKTWEVIIFNELKKRGIQPPTKRNSKEKSEKFEGAYVKDPLVGFYDWMATFDATSLYPSILMQWNISPETILDERAEVSVDGLLEKRYEFDTDSTCVAANGSIYTTEKRGIIPIVVEQMFNDRQSFKKKMLEVRNKLQDKSLSETEKHDLQNLESKYDGFQNTLKVTINALYGALGQEGFLYYDLRNAEAVTKSGQLVIMTAEKTINDFFRKLLKTDKDYVVAIDTDSVMVNFGDIVTHIKKTEIQEIVDSIDSFCKKHIQEQFDKSFKDLQDYLGCMDNKIFFKREAISNGAVYKAKKKYAMILLDNEGVRYTKPKMKIIGLETRKSTTPKMCREALEEALYLMLSKDFKGVKRYTFDFYEKFINAPIENISFPVGVNGLTKYYSPTTGYITGTPAHVKAALNFNKFVNDNKLGGEIEVIKNGDKIKWVNLVMPNPLKSPTIGFVGKPPKQLRIADYVDYETQFHKTFFSPLESIMNAAGDTLIVKDTLDEFI